MSGRVRSKVITRLVAEKFATYLAEQRRLVLGRRKSFDKTSFDKRPDSSHIAPSD